MGLAAPTTDDSLYRDRGDDVEPHRPILQGDVFRGLSIPGIPNTEANLGAVIAHPCSMRRGAQLRERIQVARVIPYQYLTEDEWRAGHYGVMPLPNLSPGQAEPHWAVRFEDSGSIPSDELLLDERVATLSDLGLVLLQQRQIMSMTRYEEVDLDALMTASRPVLDEIELLEEWNEDLCGELTGEEMLTCLGNEAEIFDELLSSVPDGETRPLRISLQVPAERAAVRRKVKDVLKERSTAI